MTEVRLDISPSRTLAVVRRRASSGALSRVVPEGCGLVWNSGLGETHAAIHRWCADHGHRLAGPSWEIYGHWEDQWNRDPSKIRADVFYLIRGESLDAV